MDRAFASGASGTPPTAPASPSIGYPTKGNAGTGTPATKPGEYWYHMITEEMRAVIAAAGLTPSQSDLTQLLQALPGALASRPEMARSLASSGYQKLPSGLIIQWGVFSTPAGTGTITFPVAFPSSMASITFSVDNSGGANYLLAYKGANTASQCTVYGAINNTPSNITGRWVAIGY